ncbi:MAG TPA: hypothetical protein VKY29_01420 [Cryomorphaceae bacterium]|nr:hypothetical protein [Cryomorphaceae bacterium]
MKTLTLKSAVTVLLYLFGSIILSGFTTLKKHPSPSNDFNDRSHMQSNSVAEEAVEYRVWGGYGFARLKKMDVYGRRG